MKKIIALMMALIMTLSLAACGEKDTPAPAQSSSSATELPASSGNDDAASETEFVPMTFGYITMSVPSVFGASTEKEGMYVSAGSDSSIVVTPTLGMDILPSEWNETVAAGILETFYGSTYTDIKLAAFEGDVNMNGNTAVYYAFNGTNVEGKERLVQVVRIFNADLTAQYMITLVHSAEDEFYTPEVSGKIINSITLAADAQNLEAELEG